MRVVDFDTCGTAYKGWLHSWWSYNLSVQVRRDLNVKLNDVFNIMAFRSEEYGSYPVERIRINLNNINVSLKTIK